MKKTLLKLVALALLAGAPVFVRAADTNAPASSAPADVKPYPLKTCLVSGEKLGGDMGQPVKLVYQGQEMKFCCKDCVKDFNKDPDKWIKKLNEAQKKEAAKTETKK
jgi:YHS domain-containing protein